LKGLEEDGIGPRLRPVVCTSSVEASDSAYQCVCLLLGVACLSNFSLF